MSKQLNFDQTYGMYFERLKQYVPIVSKVHGGTHPEFYEVHKLFDAINTKTKESGKNKPEIEEEFVKLREITKEYKIPEDVCESYEAVYHMLEKIDKAYHVV